jgi:hypothetical protein
VTRPIGPRTSSNAEGAPPLICKGGTWVFWVLVF